MTVEEIMSRSVVTVSPDDSLEKARALFVEFHFHHLLVVGDGQLLGVISDRDLLKAMSPYVDTLSETVRDRATLNKRAHQIMSRHCVTVRLGTSVETAGYMLIEKKISCLPVVDKDGHVEGIISWKDVLQSFLPNRS